MRKRKTADPCEGCFLHRERCICALIPRLHTRTRLSLVIHHRELKRTTNTGRLAVQALVNSLMVVRGKERTRLDLSSLILSDYENVILSPGDGAVDLADLRCIKPVHLIVPDGNWRQAGKLKTRHPELASLTRLSLSQKNQSQLHLRKEHFAEGHSTLEAIAKAFGYVEGPVAEADLLRVYQAKLEATLAGRPGARSPDQSHQTGQ